MSYGKYRKKTEIVDVKDITKINGYKFCYSKKKTYLELLNNGQIIKKGESCKPNYINCGTIETLEQQLCIKNDEQCPLYDVRIEPNNGITSNSQYQTDTNGNSNIYYNNQNYKSVNKKIIGKLIVSDGQPCYNINERLWRKFNSDEAGKEHLICGLIIFGLKREQRYEKVGEISYKKIYEDNLVEAKSRDLFKNIDASKKVSLYKREFLGVDKECNDKSDLFWKNFDILKKSQNQEKKVLLAESIIIFCYFIILVPPFIKLESKENLDIYIGIIFNLTFICFIICESVFINNMIKYSNLKYECSDKITNEGFKDSGSNTTKQIIFTAVNMGLIYYSFYLML